MTDAGILGVHQRKLLDDPFNGRLEGFVVEEMWLRIRVTKHLYTHTDTQICTLTESRRRERDRRSAKSHRDTLALPVSCVACTNIKMSFIRLHNFCLSNSSNCKYAHITTRHSQASDSAPVLHAPPYSPIRPNIMSSIKPDVQNVSRRCQSRTERQPQGICIKNFVKSVQQFQRYAHEQTYTHRQTDRQTDCNTPLPYQAGVNINSN